ARIRDIAAVAGLTERTVQVIVADLEAPGYLTRTRTGRRTRYSVNRGNLFRHSAQEGLLIGPFLDLLTAAAPSERHDRASVAVTHCPGRPGHAGRLRAGPDRVRCREPRVAAGLPQPRLARGRREAGDHGRASTTPAGESRAGGGGTGRRPGGPA